MAYGAPAPPGGVREIEAYFTHIRGGRAPSPEALADLVRRYRAIGTSPLDAITRAQAAALGERIGLPAFVGMRHAPPFIEAATAEAAAAGVERLVGLVLAPHFARMSLGAYESRLREAWAGPLTFVPGFHDHPAFIDALRGLLEETLAGYRPDRVFFTAHSLPERILAEGDPYVDQLLTTCRLVAASTSLPPWEFAFQSQSRTGEPWLGPDLLEAIGRSAVRRALVCPIGFTADHLEILYDLDIEAQQFARDHGVEIRRTPSFNDRPEFIEALAAVVSSHLSPAPHGS